MTFIPNSDFAEQLQDDPEVRQALQAKADEALEVARANAQAAAWDDGYIDSLDASDASLSTDHPTGHLREWGSVNNPPYAPLRKAVEQVGARFVAEEKP